MATRAIFRDGLMFPKERSALFGMAGKAGLVKCGLLQHLRACGTMRVVAIRTSHLSGCERVGRDLVRLGTLGLVTGKADLTLSLLAANFVVFAVNLVT
jgi:hypothetical protein